MQLRTAVLWCSLLAAWLLVGCAGQSSEGAQTPGDEPPDAGPLDWVLEADAATWAPELAAGCGAGMTRGADGGCVAATAALSGDAGVASSSRLPPLKPGTIRGGLARGTGDEADQALLAGDKALDRDDLEAAKRQYARARKLSATDPAPRVGLIRVRLAQTGIATSFAAAPKDPKLRALLRELDQILRLDRNYGPAHLERGRVALVLGKATEALASLEAAARLLPQDAEAQSALGVALLATGQRREALGRLRRSSELDPDNADRLANLGTAYLTLGQLGEAIRAYERAARLAPQDARANGDLGTAYLAANEPYKALPYLRRAVDLAPERATFLSNLGYAYQLTGRYRDAIATYQRALKKDDKLIEPWINLGTVYAREGRYAEAERALKQALALDPNDPRVQQNLTELEQLRKQKGTGSQAGGR